MSQGRTPVTDIGQAGAGGCEERGKCQEGDRVCEERRVQEGSRR